MTHGIAGLATMISSREATLGRPGLRRRFALARPLLLTVLMLPSIMAVVYYGFLASDRYVSEAHFVVRTASRPISASGFGAILQMTGLSKANDDVHAVQSFMGSRDAVRQLEQNLPLREVYGRSEADFLATYPSVYYGPTFEEFHQYLQSMISATYNVSTGITTLRVQAFRPEDAKAVADELLRLGELAVNGMNARIQEDAMKVSRDEVRLHEQRLIAAQIELTSFRNSELMIDPAGSSVIVTELIGALSGELAKVEAQIREQLTAASDNPALPALRRRAAAITEQIGKERMKISDASSGLAMKISQYERLVLEREFAKTSLAAAVKSLETARTEARRQQLYLERVVEPVAADYPNEPERLLSILSVTSINVIVLLIGWLLYAGMREHGAT